MSQTSFPPYSETFRVRSYEVRIDQNATLQNVCNYLQEIASNHAEKLGFGFHAMQDRNVAWFLSRLRVSVTRAPVCMETVTVTTWPSTPDRMLANREYSITDADGVTICTGSSAWAIFDLERQRPVAVPDWLGSEHWSGDKALEMPKKKPTPPTADAACLEKELTVRFSDTDMNGHANHTSYVGWLSEPLDADFVAAHRPVLLDIVFRAPCLHGETITSRAAKDGTTCSHAIVRGDQELIRAMTEWEKT